MGAGLSGRFLWKLKIKCKSNFVGGPIGSAVWTFIGYKQTDTQTSKAYLGDKLKKEFFDDRNKKYKN